MRSSVAGAQPRWLRPALQAMTLAGAVIVADRITKHAIKSDIAVGQSDKVVPGLQLVHYRNSGVAFNFLSGGGGFVVVITGLAMLALLAFFVLRPARRGVWLSTGLLVGGAIGNLLDRLLDGSVTDFIKLPHWPAFNVSDIAITLGVLSLLWVLEGPQTRRRDVRGATGT